MATRFSFQITFLTLATLPLIGCFEGQKSAISSPTAVSAKESSSSTPASVQGDASEYALKTIQNQSGYRFIGDYTLRWDNRDESSPTRDTSISASALQIFHSVPECVSSPCKSGAPAARLYLNYPANSGSAALREAASSLFSTHTVGFYLQSFGQGAAAVDPTQTIPPAGVLLEPHGAHHGLRIDSQNSAAASARVEVPADGRGIVLIGNKLPSTYCDQVQGGNCAAKQGQATLLSANNGWVDLGNTREKREIASESGQLYYARKGLQMGEVKWLRWNRVSTNGPSMACTCVHVEGGAIGPKTFVRVSPASPGEIAGPHSYTVRTTWGLGQAPAQCSSSQIARPNVAKSAYGIGAPPEGLLAETSGFEACLHLSSGDSTPEQWIPPRVPSFTYELVEQK